MKRKATISIIKQRKKSLADRNISIDDISDPLKPKVLGDFLVNKFPSKCMRKVVKTANAAIIMQSVFKSPRPNLLPLFEQIPENINVKNFLLDKVQKYHSFENNMKFIWKFLWREIVIYLSDEECTKLCSIFDISLPDVLFYISDRGLMDHVVFYLGNNYQNDVNYKKIVYENCYQHLFERAARFPNHHDHSIEALANQIHSHELMLDKFKTDKTLLKARKKLVHDVMMRNSCTKACGGCCDKYIYGGVCMDIDELVANTIISNSLLDSSTDEFINSISFWKTSLEKRIFELNDSWINAAQEISKQIYT